MHRKDKFHNLLWKLYKYGYNQWSVTQILAIIKSEFKVTDSTASRYLKEMVEWGLLAQDNFTYTNTYCKK